MLRASVAPVTEMRRRRGGLGLGPDRGLVGRPLPASVGGALPDEPVRYPLIGCSSSSDSWGTTDYSASSRASSDAASSKPVSPVAAPTAMRPRASRSRS